MLSADSIDIFLAKPRRRPFSNEQMERFVGAQGFVRDVAGPAFFGLTASLFAGISSNYFFEMTKGVGGPATSLTGLIWFLASLVLLGVGLLLLSRIATSLTSNATNAVQIKVTARILVERYMGGGMTQAELGSAHADLNERLESWRAKRVAVVSRVGGSGRRNGPLRDFLDKLGDDVSASPPRVAAVSQLSVMMLKTFPFRLGFPVLIGILGGLGFAWFLYDAFTGHPDVGMPGLASFTVAAITFVIFFVLYVSWLWLHGLSAFKFGRLQNLEVLEAGEALSRLRDLAVRE